LPDARGYDAADPLPVVELVRLAQDRSTPNLSYPWALTQFLSINPVTPGPVANVLSVRHLVGRGSPPAGLRPAWTGHDQWLMENEKALPRVTLPRSARVIPDKDARLRELGSPEHDPTVTVLEDAPVGTPAAADGTVQIAEDLPCRVRISADLSRGGIVRLADAWDAGWRATYNGQPIPILRADHALRAVVVPAGRGTIEFEYAPASFRWGLILGGVGAGGIIVCFSAGLSRRRSRAS
jgi:hypothetical protein